MEDSAAAPHPPPLRFNSSRILSTYNSYPQVNSLMDPDLKVHEKASPPTDTLEDSSPRLIEVEQDAKPLKINPSKTDFAHQEKVLAALGNLRIDRARIKPFDGSSSNDARAGGFGLVLLSCVIESVDLDKMSSTRGEAVQLGRWTAFYGEHPARVNLKAVHTLPRINPSPAFVSTTTVLQSLLNHLYRPPFLTKSLMEPHVEEHKDTASATSPQGEVSQPPNEVEQTAKPLKINPEKVLAALANLRINRSRVKPLGTSNDARRGGYGVVIPAILDPDPSTDVIPVLEDTKFVAVKKLHYGMEGDEGRVLAVSAFRQHFALEIKLLSDLSHQNVVNLIGFVEEAEEGIAWMLFRWEKKGNLREFVRSAKWELPERVSLISDVAQGLAYLHERHPPICHGDLKSVSRSTSAIPLTNHKTQLNIIVNDENRATITDFGSARPIDSQAREPAMSPGKTVENPAEHSQAQRPDLERLTAELCQSGNSLTMTGPAWTIRWAAPELLLLEGALPTLASDIWALAWIFWEGVTGNFPFEDEKNDAPVVLRILTGGLPALDTDAQLLQIKALCSLMVDCWSLEPTGRPSARACLQRLSFMSQSIPSKDPGSRSCALLLALGKVQLKNSNYEDAANYFKEAKDAAESAEDWCSFAECVQGLGDVYYVRAENEEAEEAYIKARDVFSQVGDRLGVAQCVRSLGDVCRMRNEYSRAEEAYIKARDVFAGVSNRLGVADCVQSLGDVYRMRNEYSKAEEAYIKAHDVFAEIGDRLGAAQCVQSLGETYQMRKEYSEAEEAYIKARDIFSQIGNRLCAAQCVQHLGDIYRMRDESSEAEEAYIKARDVFSQIGNQLGIAQCIQRLGDVCQMRSEGSEAEEVYIRARDVFSQIDNQLGTAQCIQRLGDVCRMRNEYSKAEEAYIKARDVFAQVDDRLGIAQCIKGLGDVYRMRNEYSEAEEAYIKARDVFAEVSNRLGVAQCVQSLGDVYRMRDEYSEAEKAYIKAQNVFSQIGDRLGVAQCVQNLGDIYRMRNEYSEAEKAFIKARDVFSQIGDRLSAAQCAQSLGDVYNIRDEYSEAEEAYIKARDVFSQVDDQLGIAQCVQSLGDVYRMRNEYSKAEEAYIKARDVFAKLSNRLSAAQCAQSLGDVYNIRDEYSEAEEAYIKARDVFSQIGNRLGVAQCVRSLADVYLMRSEYSEAEEAYIKACDVLSEIGDRLGIAQCIKGLGDVYQMRDEYSKAEETYIKARDVFAEVSNRLGIAQCVRSLGDVYRMRNEYSEAEKAYIKAREISSLIGYHRGLFNVAVGLAKVHRSREEYSDAKDLLTEAREFPSRLGDQDLIAWVDEQLASLPIQQVETSST
ncbi:hypothetical protein FRB90_011011 [Tulasnella sp. 427]|nr:hypothetical protein FRB90_011011 [Tulasnella sp. 427]